VFLPCLAGNFFKGRKNMTRRSQLRLLYHGALFMVVSMLVQFPGLWVAFTKLSSDPVRQVMRSGHAILMATGIFMVASSSILPLLQLTSRGISWLVWSFVVSGYTFIGAISIAIPGFIHRPPDPSWNQWQQAMSLPFHLGWLNVGLIGVSGGSSAIPGFLILFGAYRAMKYSVVDSIR
jgi:hypothetical protein